MAATLTPLSFKELFAAVKADNPSLSFETGETFYWSPKDRTVFYKARTNNVYGQWSLLHELSHALLDHNRYDSDVELLMLEVAAWEKAEKLAKKYDVNIDKDHIQDCLDTYRDWLHRRSACPNCDMRGLQVDSKTYRCTNCFTSWSVSSARFCRPYRRKNG